MAVVMIRTRFTWTCSGCKSTFYDFTQANVGRQAEDHVRQNSADHWHGAFPPGERGLAGRFGNFFVVHLAATVDT
jgi:hypothetical protein